MAEVKESYERIRVMEIMPSPMNPRKVFEGSEFDRFVETVKEKAVIQPILVRKIPDTVVMKGPYLPQGTIVKYEIVAGERRWRATCQAATDYGSISIDEGMGIQDAVIPAIVRELDDEAALDLMIIENFHRQDLNALEEAQAFKAWIARKGDTVGAVMELSQKISTNHQYIRRRLAVVELPASILKLWGKGDLIYGHLEQIIRVKTKKDRLDLVKFLFQWSKNEPMSVKRLKDEIDSRAPRLSDAKFDIKKHGCLDCPYNSHVQAKTLGNEFGVDGAKKKPQCLSPACFKQKQNNYLVTNWKPGGYRKKHMTNGFRFADDVSWNDWHHYPSKRHPDCKNCDHLVTIIFLTGEVQHDRVCVGPKECIEKIRSSGSRKSEDKKTGAPPGIPRVAWHGEFFREEFYKASIPARIEATRVPLTLAGRNSGGLKITQLVLFSLLKSNWEAAQWFAKKEMLRQIREII